MRGGTSFAAAVRRARAVGSARARSRRGRRPRRLRRYARAAWRMSARQRAAGRAGRSRSVPARYTGRIPNRVRRRSPAALAGYELPMALMGFPGVGWLFAGFPLAGIHSAADGRTGAGVGRHPGRCSRPYGPGPSRPIGWQAELVWLPLSALLSTRAALPRACAPAREARRRRRARGGRRRRRRRTGPASGSQSGLSRWCSSRCRSSPRSLASARARCATAYEPRLTREVTGQFLQTSRGPVKLFAWGDPQGAYPHDALRVHALGRARARRARGGRRRRSGVRLLRPRTWRQRPARGRRAYANVASRSRRTRPLRPGRYAFVATHEGMFGGRDFDYLTRRRAGRAAGTAISSTTGEGRPRSRMRCCRSLRRCSHSCSSPASIVGALRRPGGQKVLWALGFLCFAVAATAEAARAAGTVGRRRSSALYYICGRHADRRVPRRRLRLAAAAAPRTGRTARRARCVATAAAVTSVFAGACRRARR